MQVMAGLRTHWAAEKRYVHKSGFDVWVIVNGTIVRGIHGEPDHFIAHVIDISNRRTAEEEARRVSQLKDEFLATLSHELRTPLNVVAGWVHLLSKRSHPDEVRRALPVIKRNVENLRHLTDDLLGMADVLTGKVGLQRTPIDLSTLLREVAESQSLAADGKGVSMNIHIEGDALVDGDDRRLRQVFWNLLSNALKFTPEGGSISGRRRHRHRHRHHPVVPPACVRQVPAGGQHAYARTFGVGTGPCRRAAVHRAARRDDHRGEQRPPPGLGVHRQAAGRPTRV
jgi:nitrogen-specific signal transduction histidine kinase